MTGQNGAAPAKEKPWQELEADKRKADAAGFGLRATVDGTVYTAYFGELSALDLLELRRQTGFTSNSLLRAWDDDLDYDVLAVVVWLARRIGGEKRLTYAEVAQHVRWGMDNTSGDVLAPTPDPVAPVTEQGQEDDLPEA